MKHIEKVDPYDKKRLLDILAYINFNCKDYDKLDESTFLECRDSIYLLVDDMNPSIINGVIGCRRIFSDGDMLKYKCKRFDIVNSIEFLHYFYDIESDIDQSTDGERYSYRLIKECLRDKNDAFTIYCPRCPTSELEKENDVLSKLEFDLCICGSGSDEVYYNTYVKAPDVYK